MGCAGGEYRLGTRPWCVDSPDCAGRRLRGRCDIDKLLKLREHSARSRADVNLLEAFLAWGRCRRRWAGYTLAPWRSSTFILAHAQRLVEDQPVHLRLATRHCAGRVQVRGRGARRHRWRWIRPLVLGATWVWRLTMSASSKTNQSTSASPHACPAAALPLGIGRTPSDRRDTLLNRHQGRRARDQRRRASWRRRPRAGEWARLWLAFDCSMEVAGLPGSARSLQAASRKSTSLATA